MTEKFTLENGNKAFRSGFKQGILMTQNSEGRISLYQYNDETESSQFITSLSQEELNDLSSYFAS